MADALQLAVSVETTAAIESLRRVVNVLDEMSSAVSRADTAISGLEKTLKDAGDAGEKAGGQAKVAASAVEDLSQAAEDARKNVGTMGSVAQETEPPVGRLGSSTEAAAENTAHYTQTLVSVNTQINTFNTTVTKTNPQTKDLAENTGALTTKTTGLTGLASQVQAWVASWAGLQGVIQLFEKFNDRMRETVDAQRELVDSRLTHDQRLEMLMGNLGLKGEAGQTRARNLRDDLLKRAPVSDEKAIEALSIANSTGHDPRDSEGMEFATQLAYLAQREQLNKETVTQIVRSLKGRGLDSVAGLKKAIAKGDAQFEVSASTDRQAFWRGYVSGVLPALPKGVDPDYASSIYSGFLNTKIGEEAAGQATAHAFAFAQGTNKQSLRYFAQQAAQLGVTQPGTVSDDDARRFLDADKSGQAQSYRRDQDRLRKLEEEEKLAYVTGRHTGKRLMSKRQITSEVAALHDFDPEGAVQELGQTNARAAEQLSGMIAQARQMNDASRGLLEKTKEQLAQKQEAAAYLKVGLEDRMSRVVLPTIAGLQTDEDVNRFNAEVGGQFRRLDNVEMLGAASTQAQVRKAQAAAQAAQARDTDEQNQSYEELDTAKQTRAESRNLMSVDASTDAGMLYMKAVLTRAEEARRENAAKGVYTPDPQEMLRNISTLTESKDAYLIDEAAKLTKHDIEQMWAQLRAADPSVRQAYGHDLGELEKEFDFHTTGITGQTQRRVSPAAYAQTVDGLVISVGNLKHDLERASRVASAPPSEERLAQLKAEQDQAARRLIGLDHDPQATEAQRDDALKKMERANENYDVAVSHARPSSSATRPIPTTRPSNSPPVSPAAVQSSSTTQPASDGGHAQVIHHHHYNQVYHTQHVGNLWAGPDDPMDLPGPLEDWG